MNRFVFQNPTKIIFGEGALAQLSPELDNFGKNVLFAYGMAPSKSRSMKPMPDMPPEKASESFL